MYWKATYSDMPDLGKRGVTRTIRFSAKNQVEAQQIAVENCLPNETLIEVEPEQN